MSSSREFQDFNFERLVEQGETLNEKAVDVHLINGRESLARWYFSQHHADLMIWFDEKNSVERFQLNSNGQIVDWSRAEGLHTGLIVELEMDSGQAETIKFDHSLDVTSLNRATIVIENCSALNPQLRQSLLSELVLIDSKVPHITRSSPSVPRMTSSRSRFWNRFKRWTIGT